MSTNTSTVLTCQIEGTEYNTVLSVFININKRQLVFQGWSYELASGIGGDLQLRLNWGTNQFLPHFVRASGTVIILVPTVWSTPNSLIKNENAYISFSDYISKTKGKPIIFPKKDLVDIWAQLGYSVTELDQVMPISSSETLLIWLLRSKYNPQTPEIFDLNSYAKSLCHNILAEDPSLTPSIKDTILDILEKNLSFQPEMIHTPELTQPVNVYISQDDNRVLEWPAMFVSDKSTCIIDDSFTIRLIA